MNERQMNLDRISQLHKWMRWAAIGECPPECAGLTLGGISAELKNRLAIELIYLEHDPPVPIQVILPPGTTFKDGKVELPEGKTFDDVSFKPGTFDPKKLDPRRN